MKRAERDLESIVDLITTYNAESHLISHLRNGMIRCAKMMI